MREYIHITNYTDAQTKNEVITVLKELVTLPWTKLDDGTIMVSYPIIYPFEKFRRFLEVLQKCNWRMKYE